MAVPLLDLKPQHDALADDLRATFDEALESGAFILGPYVEQFESALAKYCSGCPADQSVAQSTPTSASNLPNADEPGHEVIGVSSGTDALLVSMMALGIGPGDEVITSPMTFFSTAGSISRVGATPVFAEINPRTLNLEPEAIEGAITPSTKAIMPVHLFGLPADMEPIKALASRYGLKVIEDAAQALGARYKDRHVGTLGDVGCYSFYPSKNLAGLGDGGAVITANANLAHEIRQLRNHGIAPDGTHTMIGGNFRLNALQAALLGVKLPHLDAYEQARHKHASRYNQLFEDLRLTTPPQYEDRYHVFNQYTIRVRGRDSREALRMHLDACGIGNRIYYQRPLHLQPCYQHLNYKPGMLPASEQACDEVLSLPCFPEMSRSQQDEVVRAVNQFFEGD